MSKWPDRNGMTTLARGLGWFSLALGAAELLAPRKLTNVIGADEHDALTRGYGVREIGAGIGILASRDPTPWVWARVAGDLLDLATLAPTLQEDNPRRPYAMTAFGNVAAITVLDLFCAMSLSRSDRSRHDGSLELGRLPGQSYEPW